MTEADNGRLHLRMRQSFGKRPTSVMARASCSSAIRGCADRRRRFGKEMDAVEQEHVGRFAVRRGAKSLDEWILAAA